MVGVAPQWIGRDEFVRIGDSPVVDHDEVERWVRVDGSRTERVVRASTLWIWDGLFRLRSYGQEHLPEDGPVLFCPNHSSWWDPFLQARGQRRVLRFMAKASLFDVPGVRTIVSTGGAFPVRRGEGDTFAIELARRLLAEGQPVVVYPEGTRFRADDRLGTPRSGAARLALETGVQVVPVASYGTKPRKARGHTGPPRALPRVTTLYGPPMSFVDLDPVAGNVPVVRDAIWQEVQRLYDLARDLHGRRIRPRRFAVPHSADR